jgi:hypothetical protein
VTAIEAAQETQADEPGRARRWCVRLGRIAPFLVLLALLLHPTQVTVRQLADLLAGLAGRGQGIADLIPPVGICASDVLFLVAFAFWVAWRAVDGGLSNRLRSYPRPLAALLIAGAVSAVPFLKSSALFTGREFDWGDAATELVQLVLVFGCTFAVLGDYLRDPIWRRRLIAAFLLAAVAGLVVGVWEYGRLLPSPSGAAEAGHTISPVDVDGTFGFEGVASGADEQIGTKANRNVLGAWVSLVLPLLWGIALWAPRPSVRGICGVSAWAGMLLLLSGGLWAVTLGAMLLVSCLRGRRAFAFTAAGLFVFWALVFRFAPQQHGLILVDSLMLRRTHDRFHTLPVYGAEGTARTGAPAVLADSEDRAWQQKFIEWQPGLQALMRDPLVGVGIGNYQNNINLYYQPKPDPTYNPDGAYDVPKPSENLMETGANSQYLVWAVEAGLAGLFALVWVLLFGVTSAGRTALTAECAWRRALGLGSLGALCAAAGGMLFTSYFVRGVGIAFAFILALSATLESRAPTAEPVPDAEPEPEPEPMPDAEPEPEPEPRPEPELEPDGTAELMAALERDEGPDARSAPEAEGERAPEEEPGEGRKPGGGAEGQ